MVFVGAVVLPHGAMSFDGQGSESPSKSCRERYNGLPNPLKNELSCLFDACTKAAESVANLKPDIVVFHTCHGISLSKHVAVYLNTVAKGNALWNGEWSEFEVEIPMDEELASKILQHLQEDKLNAEGVTCFTRTETPLRWGEVIPLWYLQEQFKKSGYQPKYIVLSQSLKRDGSDVNEERIAIGKSLAVVVDNIDAKVVVAISGDLSHAHQHCYNNIPLYLPDPRWNLPQSDKAAIFDRAIEGWARSCHFEYIKSSDQLPSVPCDKLVRWDAVLAMKWLDFAADLQPVAKSCGFCGFFVLHGLLSHYVEPKNLQSQVFGRFAPTYYGMMAAVFTLI